MKEKGLLIFKYNNKKYKEEVLVKTLNNTYDFLMFEIYMIKPDDINFIDNVENRFEFTLKLNDIEYTPLYLYEYEDGQCSIIKITNRVLPFILNFK